MWRSTGEQIWLGEIVGRGGEGTVHAIAQHPELVAKRYTTPPDPLRAAKLSAMVALSSDDLLRIAAWPLDTLHAHPRGPVVGFLMPRLSGHLELHKLSHPLDRARAFPEVGYDFLVHVAANVARVFQTLHARGVVIGDVNESGVMVHPDGTVRVIDCDSMQLTAQGTLYPCDVGKPEFQPPELLRGLTSFRGLTRAPSHDAFGLAVLLFQLLFLGWHPFAVRMLTGEQQPTADNIRAGRFPYARGLRSTEFTRPPHALDPSFLPAPLRDLFEAAFLEGAVRPAPADWVRALERLAAESRPCTRFGTHFFHESLPGCPFCALDARLGFPVLPRITLDAAQLKALWTAIQRDYFELSARAPAPPPAPPAALHPPPPTLVAFTRTSVRLRRLQLASLSLSLPLGLLSPPLFALSLAAPLLELARARLRPPEVRALGAAHGARLAEVGAAEAALAAPADAAITQNYEDARAAFARIRAFDTHRNARLLALHERLVDAQLVAWLERHPLTPNALRGLPPKVFKTLARRHLETTADIPRLLADPQGMAPAHLEALGAWHQRLSARFVPDLDDPGYLQRMHGLNATLDAEYAALLDRLKLAREWLSLRLPEHRQARAAATARLSAAREELLAYARIAAHLEARLRAPR